MSSADYEEVVVATYNGRIMGLTTQTSAHHTTRTASQESQSKITALKYAHMLITHRAGT